VRALASAVAATLLLGVCGSALAGAQARRPTLRILDVAPLKVQGANFKPGERVTLLVNAGRPLTKGLKAGGHGGFTVRLGVSVKGCTAVVVQAIGARGSRAMADLTMPGCDDRP
jgi:hypothetical protein